jgi:hypothetical protein
MPKTQLIIRKVLEGRIAHNDGDFAEIETIGTEGIEKNLWLDTIQTHREDSAGALWKVGFSLISLHLSAL